MVFDDGSETKGVFVKVSRPYSSSKSTCVVACRVAVGEPVAGLESFSFKFNKDGKSKNRLGIRERRAKEKREKESQSGLDMRDIRGNEIGAGTATIA